MEFNEILTCISTVGFPIVMTLLLWIYITKEQQNTREVLHELKTSVDMLAETVRLVHGGDL